jgi:uncharacterized protein YutE (UPF0331/DUF86 family)
MPPGLANRYSHLRRSAERLIQIRQRYDFTSFINNQDVIDITLRNFQVMVQCMLDIGSYLISGMGVQKPTSNVDIFRILEEAGVLKKDEVKICIDFVKQRNIIVHEYIDIDYGHIFNSLKNIEFLLQIAQKMVPRIDTSEL